MIQLFYHVNFIGVILLSYLINKETGAKIASTPEELPPLRDGYVRLIHQTHFDYADSLLENGLIYNSEYAGNMVSANIVMLHQWR